MSPRYPDAALVIVDMQKYYLQPDAPYCRYFDTLDPGSLDYVRERCDTLVVPNIRRLIDWSRAHGLAIVYLRLCGRTPDRSDLHRFFLALDERVQEEGFGHAYPLESEPHAAVIDALAPLPEDAVFEKTTFSGFASGGLEPWLEANGIRTLVMTGLATSQCVETTARDASDRGYDVIQIDDAQADYDPHTHRASIISSRGVCGGEIYQTAAFIEEDPLAWR